VYRIGVERELAAAYYRNSIIHFFVTSSIAELALLRAAEEAQADSSEAFWNAAMELRDLLKFEFFFAEKEGFRAELRQELTIQKKDWQRHLGGGSEAVRELLRAFRPFNAHRVLRPFLEAYRLVGDHLERWDTARPVDAAGFVSECTGLGRQYHLQQRIRSASSVSQVLIRTALDLAANRGLLDPATPDVAGARRAFAEEIRGVIRRIDAIETLHASRRVGLID